MNGWLKDCWFDIERVVNCFNTLTWTESIKYNIVKWFMNLNGLDCGLIGWFQYLWTISIYNHILQNTQTVNNIRVKK